MLLNNRSPADRALRAVRDCRVIRARWSHPAFDALRKLGWVSVRPVPNRFGWVDFRLTIAGQHAADQLKPWSDT